MPIIDCQNLSKRFGAHAILDGASLTLRRGEHVGLIGASGSGKTTLARILIGEAAADTGEISLRRGAQVELLEQDPVLPEEASIREVVLASLRDWSAARAHHAELTAQLESAPEQRAVELTQLQARAGEEVERLGGWERMHEAEAIVSHLGIRDADRPIRTLSGGERRRAALARVLVGEPDLAILDEPTNHLDLSTIEWLEEHLAKRFRGALLLITHDRYFLDRIATRTLELYRGTLTAYEGGYARYLEAKTLRQEHADRAERNRQNFLRRELEWLKRGPKARGTKQKARIARARSALSESAPAAERTADLRAISAQQGKKILHVSELGLERGGRTLVAGLNLDLVAGERIGVVGSNGSGKSSWFECLQGSLPASAGVIEFGIHTRIGYLDQQRSGLDADLTLREAVVGDREVLMIGGEEVRSSVYLERFLFDARTQRTRVSVLSGGERSRACLAKLLCQRSNLLLLDEPTNDLDVSTITALEAMLLDFSGCALIISHDRWFLDRVATSILSFEADGKLDLQRGNYSAYRERRDERERVESRPRQSQQVRRSRSRSALDPGPRKLSFAERRELEGLLERIEEAELQLREIEERLADPATYRNEASVVADLAAALDPARARVEELVARWEELELRRSAD